ncbi:MAG: GNAT family N-acetyltransferase [bacterium]|nr:GNAT family N-acetyltransferase [bacterium]
METKKEYRYVTLRACPQKKDEAAKWFHSKWGVPTEAYLACMNAYLKKETEYGWYFCLDGETIVAGMGVIENDFHERKDLTPNICAVYTEEAHRGKGIAGNLLNMVVEDMREKGISPVYLLTNHEEFYERYGWEFFCMVKEENSDNQGRIYIHR